MPDHTAPYGSVEPTRILMVASMASSIRNFRGQLVADMIGRGHEVHVAAPALSKDAKMVDWLKQIGATGHDVELERAGLSPIADLKALLQLYLLMDRLRPGLFIGYTIKPVIWGLLAASFARVPRRVCLITGLGYALLHTEGLIRRQVRNIAYFLYRRALQCSTLVFFQNPDDAAEFRKRQIVSDNHRVVLVNGSGVDTENFSQVAYPPLPLRFLFIGRLIAEKGIREFVEAAVRIRLLHPEIVFDLVGGVDSNPTSLSEAEVQGWVADGNLRWHGTLADVRSIIAACHVLVLPSYREGTPRVVLEAMSMGRAVITSDAPGCRETVINGQNGILVPIQDVDALVAAMLSIIEEPGTIVQMGQAGRNIAISKYDVHQVNAVMLNAMKL